MILMLYNDFASNNIGFNLICNIILLIASNIKSIVKTNNKANINIGVINTTINNANKYIGIDIKKINIFSNSIIGFIFFIVMLSE